MMRRIFCFDLETTGLPGWGRMIVPVQIAGLVLDAGREGLPAIAEFNRFLTIPAWAHIEAPAMAMHAAKGRTFEFFQNEGDLPSRVYTALHTFLMTHMGDGNKTMVAAGHNVAAFDLPILKYHWERCMGDSLPLPIDRHVLDTQIESTWAMMTGAALERVSLSATAAYWGVPLDPDEAHDAMTDTRVTAEVLRRQWAARVKNMGPT